MLMVSSCVGAGVASAQTVYTVTSAADSGAGTLRKAIMDANDSPGKDTIRFAIPGAGVKTIAPTAALPQINEPLVIDGYTQPGYAGLPLIQLNGTSAGASANGLLVLGGETTIRGLAINRFKLDGIRIEGAGENVIQGNILGADATGRTAMGNGQGGITVYQSSGNRIGGTNSGEGNLISGGAISGIYIAGPGASNNVILGNRIGTDITGQQKLGNGQNGIVLSIAADNRIGGAEAGSTNLISGNGQSGVYLLGPQTVRNVVLGNLIGTDITGTNGLGNVADGVTIYGAVSNTIGGTVTGARNIISGNGQRGVLIMTTGAKNNVVVGNYIGTDISGRLAVSNAFAGVAIDGVASNRVGGGLPFEGNVLSGNGQSGVALSHGAIGNVIQGNLIGTDAGGSVGIGNGYYGINLEGASNLIGGTRATERNVISSNLYSGINLTGAGTSNNVFQGNFIGTDAQGKKALGNQFGGIYVYGCGRNQIGGTGPGAGNLISGNIKDGISLGDPGATGNVVQGNFIGTQADGITALGNQWHGLELLNTASNNIIGGTTMGAGNRIAYAQEVAYDGVRIRSGCTRNEVRGNAIFGNAGLATDLEADGVTATNTPVLTSASGRYVTQIQGSLTGWPRNTAVTMDFYANATKDPTGYGEGETWMGSSGLTTDAAGKATFSVALTNRMAVTGFISATATDAGTGTSEYSACVAVTTTVSPDTDGDGMPDDYEAAWGFSAGNPADGKEDADGDGQSNRDEYLAGTSPRDATDRLGIITLEVWSNQAWLWFASKPGKSYTLEYADTLGGGWKQVGPKRVGAGPYLGAGDSWNTNVPSRYYRVVSP